MRIRGTAVVFRSGKVLLVKDQGQDNFSLPGGGQEPNEPILATAIRELYEEVGMSATRAERLPRCDYQSSKNLHQVVLIETTDDPVPAADEISDFLWWDRQEAIPRFPHVDRILANF